MSINMSRRNFLKVSAAGLAGVAASTAVGGLSTAAAEENKAAQTGATGAAGISGTAHVVDRATLEKKAWNDPSLLLKVRWSGVNFYEFVLPNGKTIVMDPYFDDPNNEHNEYKYTPTDLPGGKWVHGADYILLTHGHHDHTGELRSVVEEYPAAQIIVPENTIPSVMMREKVSYNHYWSEAGAHDKFELDGVMLETCRSNHNLSKFPVKDEFDPAKYTREDGSIDYPALQKMIYEREIMNMKLTTDEGFTILIWNSEMQPDGMGFETRRYFYRDVNPDLFMYQVAGASLGYDRRNPTCGHMGEFIASVKGKAALPEHQQHFSYEELDAMAARFSDVCNEKGVGTAFMTPETGVWYGYSKDEQGNVSICLVEEA